jgi:ring-1,2-phenylacetyl-CoA epoxidase subunit PaaB
MSTILSLDPRITRAHIPEESAEAAQTLAEHELFETYEVFHQAKTGGRHTHVGSVHAPNPEMAYLFAKEQFGRRMTTTSIWVAKTTDIFTTADSDADMFETAATAEKEYRNANMWKVRDKIDRFKKEQTANGSASGSANGSADDVAHHSSTESLEEAHEH